MPVSVQPERSPPSGCHCGHSHSHSHSHGDDNGDGARPHANDNTGSAVAAVAAPSCLAEQFWMPWRLIVMNPLPTLMVYAVFNVLFISISFVLWLLAVLVTPLGLVVLLLLALTAAVRQITLVMTYPGQLDLVVRDVEHNFARLIKRRLAMALEALQDLVALLSPSDRAPNHRLRFLQTQQNAAFSVETLVRPLQRALEAVDTMEGKLGPNGANMLAALRELTAFHDGELRRACAELAAAPSKDYDVRRMQLFGAAATADTSASSAVESALVTTLRTRVAALRLLLPVVGTTDDGESPSKKDAAWVLQQLCQRRARDVDVVATLDLMRADLAVRFNGEQVWIPSTDDHQIDAMLLRGTRPPLDKTAGDAARDRPTIIYCNPNGGLYEFHHLQMEWAKFYTDLGCDVLLFNYRGYGRCKGEPSPAAHNQDGLAIVQFLQSRRGVSRLGVHGESIGGLVATYLAYHAPAIQVAIVDRTFANLPALAQRLVGRWAGPVVEWLTWWETNNTAHVIVAPCHTLICSDPEDEIIVDGASLKSGVALRCELDDDRAALQRGIPLEPSDDETTSTPMRSWIGTRAPLSEASLRRFGETALSLGRRAMRYARQRDTGAGTGKPHIEILVLDDTDTESEQQRMLHHAGPSLAFPEELLAATWMQLACLDGYCGQCFLQAAERGGYDQIRAWTASLLHWGSRLSPDRRLSPTLPPFERQGIMIRPLPLPHVHKALQQLLEEHPGAKFDVDIGFVFEMVEYLMDTMTTRWRQRDGESLVSNATPVNDVNPPTNGSAHQTREAMLLTLHCGHNRNFSDREKVELVAFLRKAGFISAS
ncbi:hypothetical protein P43SY_004946 [Pythium insidiosum]|uniref:AB hydrolase-1 domain-containing protein n=1 Tax=Pythium insidiosum TaxID=114742 RepID=A0AAD5LA68_PYTIN|nr:hypothetical protein P43SY_004946 [Pythium insidiosum]